MRRHRLFAGILAAFLGATLLISFSAYAQHAGEPFLPTAPSTPTTQPSSSGGNFSCNGASASGDLFDSGMETCPVTLKMDNLFSFFICNMEKLSSNLLGHMFCGMMHNLTPAVMAVLTLSVVFFGIGFTVGVIPATAREFQKYLLKTAIIIVFATQAEYLIGYGYNFLVGGAREGIAVALSGMYKNPHATGADVYGYLDRFLGKAVQFATDAVGAKKENGEDPCKNAVFAVMAIMLVAFPPLFFLGLLLCVKIALTFIRAAFGYIYAVVGIAFLLTLAPIFLSFAMFQQTRSFFDKWIGYLTSFALQMMIVFAFLAFVVSIDVKHISGGITDIIVFNEQAPEGTSVRMPWEYCTLCHFKVVDRETKADIPPEKYDELLKRGTLQCTGDGVYQPTDSIAPGGSTNNNEGGNGSLDNEATNTLLKFTAVGLLSLVVLAYLVDAILILVPSLAQFLAGGMGGSYAPQLGGGGNRRGAPVMDIPGVQDLGQGRHGGILGRFGDNFSTTYGETGNLGRSFSDAMSLMVTGRHASPTGEIGRGEGGDASRDPGLIGGFARWVINPHRDIPDA